MIKSIRLLLSFSFIITLVMVLAPTDRVRAMTNESSAGALPSLDVFVRQIHNSQAGELRGLYIPEVLAAPIVQQPAGMDDFVSPWQNVVTQFTLASKLGSTGLLAHNYLAGKTFARIQKGQEVHLVYGDGRISTFIVTDILRYQAIEPGSTSSTFLDLESHVSLTYAILFTKIYNRPGQVIFQTCVEAGNDPTWGRLFVIARPVPE